MTAHTAAGLLLLLWLLGGIGELATLLLSGLLLLHEHCLLVVKPRWHAWCGALRLATLWHFVTVMHLLWLLPLRLRRGIAQELVLEQAWWRRDTWFGRMRLRHSG